LARALIAAILTAPFLSLSTGTRYGIASLAFGPIFDKELAAFIRTCPFVLLRALTIDIAFVHAEIHKIAINRQKKLT